MNNQPANTDELAEKIAAGIRADEKFERFFKDYSPSSVNSFIKIYAVKKAMWTIYGPLFKTELEKMETQWENEAMERLQEIQQVKLFLFQCRFRANAIERPVEGLRTIFDFLYWKENILNARFLDPVTENDIQLYTEYLMGPDVNHQPLGFIEDWQDFEPIRLAYNNEDETDRTVPEWYSFYFSRTGHGIELTLPDERKEKDIFYFLEGNNERVRLLQEERKKAIAENPALAPETGEYFMGHEEHHMNRFMNVFEDKDNRDMYEVYKAWCDYNEKEELLRSDLDMLMYAKEDIPVDESPNWIEAIQLTAARYRSIKIAESLPAAYGQYKMNLDLGITFPEKEGSTKQSEFYNNLVLLGRKLHGEPENFDY